MAGRILVLQHAPHSSLGAYGDVLSERGDETAWVRLHDGESVPERLDGFDAVISLGAAISVYDGDAPWLAPELELLRAAVTDDVPVWGICFGAQMLAAAAGGRVWRGARPEVGIRPLAMTSASVGDPVFGPLGQTVQMFHWHGDSFDLPADAVLLAGSDEYPNQAFRVGRARLRRSVSRGGNAGPRARLDRSSGDCGSARGFERRRRDRAPL